MAFDRLRALIRRRVRYHVTRGGLLFFGALGLTAVVAFLSGNNLLFLIFAAMLALLLVSGFLSRLVLAGLEVELLLPQHVGARITTSARLRIRNLKRLTPSFSIEVSGRSDDPKTPPILTAPLYFPLIPGRQSVEAAIQVVFPRRGRHKENVFVLSTGFPFGFLRKSVQVALHRETVVYPALETSVAAEELFESLMAAITGEGGTEVRGIGSDFYRIRPYVPQDSARHVDWKSTAHTGSLQVREFARDDQRTAEVWFDRAIRPGGEADFETLIERCAYVVWNLSERDISCTFRSDSFAVSFPGEGDIYDILRFLALVEPFIFTSSDGSRSGRQVEFPYDDTNPSIVFSTLVRDAPISERTR